MSEFLWHQVRDSETIEGICLDFGVCKAAVKKANSLISDSIVQLPKIIIPFKGKSTFEITCLLEKEESIRTESANQEIKLENDRIDIDYIFNTFFNELDKKKIREIYLKCDKIVPKTFEKVKKTISEGKKINHFAVKMGISDEKAKHILKVCDWDEESAEKITKTSYFPIGLQKLKKE